MGVLWLDVGTDDILRIDGDVAVTLERKSGSRARMRFDGPGKVELVRRGRSVQDAAEPLVGAHDARR